MITDHNTAKIWDTQTGQLKHILTGHTHEINAVAISPDNSFIVTGSWDNTAKIWTQQQDGTWQPQTLRDPSIEGNSSHTNWISLVAISADNSFIVTGSKDNTAKIWNPLNGQLLRILTGHADWISSVAISTDNSFIVTGAGTQDNTAKIWNAQNGQLLGTLTGHTNLIPSVAISSDNSFIVTGSLDQTAKIWQFIDPALKQMLKSLTLQQVQLIFMKLKGMQLPNYAHDILPPLIIETLGEE